MPRESQETSSSRSDEQHPYEGVGDDGVANSNDYDKMRTPSHSEEDAERAQAGAQEANDGDAGQEQQEEGSSDDLMHGINSFWALVFPVCVTMVASSLVVVNYRNSSVEASMQTYLVYGNSETNGGAAGIGMSLVNALVIIGAIAILTFGMALLYKFNCMKFLAGYIMFAATAILSFVGGQLMDSVLSDQFNWPVDWISFVFVMLNFGVVGVISIFYQKGTPRFIQNAYLVAVSVILAWEFSMWPMWTTLVFCVMFACYDLCAVLTPCGPLKWLLQLIQEKNAPLPGLLYEADIRDGVTNQQNNRPAERPAPPSRTNVQSSSSHSQQRSAPPPQAQNRPVVSDHIGASSEAPATQPREVEDKQRREQELQSVEHTDRPRNVAESDFTTYQCDTFDALVELLEKFYRIFSPEDVWKAPQVAEKFFEDQDRLWILIFHKYQVCSCTMEIPCPVQVRRQRRRRERQQEEEEDKTIKLGLGDFIFYSVLVGRSAMYDFSTFVTTFLCIIMGLGGTLFLLSVLHKSLPALPISIFLATAIYLWTRYLFVDFCDFMMTNGALG